MFCAEGARLCVASVDSDFGPSPPGAADTERYEKTEARKIVCGYFSLYFEHASTAHRLSWFRAARIDFAAGNKLRKAWLSRGSSSGSSRSSSSRGSSSSTGSSCSGSRSDTISRSISRSSRTTVALAVAVNAVAVEQQQQQHHHHQPPPPPPPQPASSSSSSSGSSSGTTASVPAHEFTGLHP